MIQHIALSALALLLVADFVLAQPPDAARVLAVVNGTEITEADLAVFMISRRIPSEQKADVRGRLVEILIERQLMREYLNSRKAKPSQTELNQQLARIRKIIRDGGDDPNQVLKKLGISEAVFKKELALPLAWKSYLRLMVSNDRLRQYFEKHRPRFDGTQVCVRQVFLKLSKDANAVKTKTDQLTQLKSRIEKGEISFADAAVKHSEAPSKKNGGDAGWIPYRGELPAVVSQTAFELETGAVSEPVRSPFGLHLITVTERKPGDLSLEDVRSIVFNRLSQELWEETVKSQRQKAKIEIRAK